MDLTHEQFQQLELAKAYIALSNAHRLDLVFGLLSNDAVYESTNVGLYEGKPAIETMMRSFFNQYPDVAWETRNLRMDSQEDNAVVFEFLMTATDPNRGTPILRKGNEKILFSNANLIERVVVKNIK